MLFNSYPFLFFFLPSVLFGFYLFCKWHLTSLAKLWLLIASLAFYGYWDVRFVPLLGASILFNYAMGEAIDYVQDAIAKKCALAFGIACDLALLFYFKYTHFFLTTISKFSGWYYFAEVALPLGISFFTFTQIAYLVDLYRGEAKKGSLLNYALFVTIFPHLIAGPILHHKEMIGQFNRLRMFVFSAKNVASGIFLFTLGLFKKVAIADHLSTFGAQIFDEALEVPLTLIPAWVGALSYSLQLYFDFSGYSDMAVGLGLLFNMRLPINFNSPYQATSIIDFWRRWHITLSHFLRDYLYIPLGGNRKGESARLRNLLVTMVLGGLWHGAGWTYVLWGTCHGLFLVCNHLWRKVHVELPNWFSRTITLIAVVAAWAIFRAPSTEKAFEVLSAMFGFAGVGLPLSLAEPLAFLSSFGITFIRFTDLHYHMFELGLVFVLIAVVLKAPNSFYWNEKFIKKPALAGMTTAVMAVTTILNLEKISEFLYYQF